MGGPGGVPDKLQLLPELLRRWQPPPPLAQAAPDGPPTIGQVSGAKSQHCSDRCAVVAKKGRKHLVV